MSEIKAEDKLKEDTVKYISKELEKLETLEKLEKMENGRSGRARRILSSAVCCAVIFLVGFSTHGFITEPTSYISIDVNPSIELTLNRFDRVVVVKGYNDDAKDVLDGLELKWKDYTDAIDSITKSAEIKGYLDEDSLFEFAVISPKDSQIIEGIENCYAHKEYNSSCHSIDGSNVEKAHHSGLSFGKYQAYQELAEVYPSITLQEVKAMSMHQIREHISCCQGGVNNSINNNDQTDGANNSSPTDGENNRDQTEVSGNENSDYSEYDPEENYEAEGNYGNEGNYDNETHRNQHGHGHHSE